MKPWQVAHANSPYRDPCSTSNWLFGLLLWEGAPHDSRGDSRRSFVRASWLRGRLPGAGDPAKVASVESGGEPRLSRRPPRQATRSRNHSSGWPAGSRAQSGVQSPTSADPGGEPDWPETEPGSGAEREQGGKPGQEARPVSFSFSPPHVPGDCQVGSTSLALP